MSKEDTDKLSKKAFAQACDRLLNAKIPHGAFRLWYGLLSFRNKYNGRCNPGDRKVSERIKCKTSSIEAWCKSLVDAKFLKADRQEKKRSYYIFLDGLGNELFGKNYSRPTAPRKGYRNADSTVPHRGTPLYPIGEETAPPTGDITNQEPNCRNQKDENFSSLSSIARDEAELEMMKSEP